MRIVGKEADDGLGFEMTDPKLWGAILIGVGIILIIAQVVYSMRAAKKAKEAREQGESGGFTTMDIGSVIGGIIAELAKTVPLAAGGIVLIIIGAVFMGVLPPTIFTPNPSGSPSPAG